ncbi:MAG: hypothetical protein WC004_03655 [Candidatus Absconditabacterales bacterium]
MMTADLPPKSPIESTYIAPTLPETSYVLHANSLADILGPTPNPSELLHLYMTDYPQFIQQFYEYITSDDMKAETMDGFDRDQYKKYMKQYFVNMNENVPLKQLPAPLRKGYEDLFRAGAENQQFKKAVQSMLVPTSALIDKKTGKMKGIYGSDSGSGFTGKIVILMIDLYNTTFTKPAETSAPEQLKPTTKTPTARA